MHEHLAALHSALQHEQRAEAAEHQRLAALPEDEQIHAGFAWPALVVTSVERAGRRHRLVLRATKGVVLHDGIGAGDPVFVDGEPGSCIGVEGGMAEVSVFKLPAEGRPVRVSRRHDAATFVGYRQALERADAHRSPLREVLLGAAPSEATTAAPPAGLDAAQEAAAAHALGAAELAVIHGPPGTGKTRMLGAVLHALVARGERPWALADSNAAVDHLALQAAAASLDVVRLGHPARIGSKAAGLSLDARIASSPLGPALVALDRELSRTQGGVAIRRLLDTRRRLRDQARTYAIEGAQVIACTFGTLCRRAAELPAPTTAVVDEATQATEPAVWVAVPYVDRLVLVGDPEQLGPVTRAPSPLERSLLQRLVDEARLPLPMLQVQHRMARGIRELVAEVYGPAYTDHPAAAEQRLGDLPATSWIDTAGADLGERVDPTTRSLYNQGEAALVGLAVRQLRESGVDPDRIGVITPYSAQVACLAKRPELAGIEVATVNAFQGREKDAIAVSWVRSNDHGELGFVSDARRLTVALTRARRWLWQVGDSATLARHPRFDALVAQHAAAGALHSAWEPPWFDALADANSPS